MNDDEMKTEWVHWFDKSIPIGTRKRHYINYNLHQGWTFNKTINYANKIFGKKPNYTEPDKSKFYPEECEHEFLIDYWTVDQDVRCMHCGETCPDCAGYPGYGEFCSTCGTYE